eukprot:g587.t1
MGILGHRCIICYAALMLLACAVQAVRADDDDEEEDKNTTAHRKPTSLVIVSVFVLFGIVGEKALEYLEEHTPEDLKPIQEAILTEMTLMGVIGIVTFILGKFQALNSPSKSILGEDDAINEMLEKIHMLLFFILVVFLSEAVYLIAISKRRVALWKRWNEASIDKEKLRTMLEAESSKKANDQRVHNEMLSFVSIRQRFVHNPTGLESINIPKDFDFHRYLGQSTGLQISHLVKLDSMNWAGLWILFGGFWALQWSFDHTAYIIIVSSCPFLLIVVQFFVLRKMHHILDGSTPRNYHQFVRRKSEILDSAGADSNAELGADSTASKSSDSLKEPLVTVSDDNDDDDDDDISADLSVPDPQHLRPHVSDGDHTELFWFHKSGTTRGPDFLREVVRMLMLIMAVFISYIISIFIPQTLFGDKHHVATSLRVTSLVLLILPILWYFWYIPDMVITFVTITSIEKLKQKKIAIKVKRMMATAKAVRALKCLRKMLHSQTKSKAHASTPPPSSKKHIKHKPGYQKWLDKNRRFLREMFNNFDADGSGRITDEELKVLLVKNNLVADGTSLSEVIHMIDEDGSGDVCFEEFALWVASGHYEDEDIKESVEGLFKMIDLDGDGHLTHAEFKKVLQTHAKDLTDSDISAIISEIDEDRNGMVDEEEFSKLLRVYSKLY